MAEYNPEWGRCLRELLSEAGCASGRLAEKFTNGAMSHGQIVRMMDGLVPQYGPKLVKFLSFFNRSKAAACLQILGYPVPRDWLRPQPPIPPEELAKRPGLRQVVEHLTGPPHEPTESREEMIERAFEFVIKDPDVKVGSAAMASHPIEAKLSLIRLYEQHTGRKLLPDWVI